MSFVRPPSAAEAVMAELRRRISGGELAPGDRIRADVLGPQLGVSRVPVREALMRLEGEGRLEYRPHRGWAVARLNADELREIYRMRELLEGDLVSRAVPRASAGVLDRMRAADAALAAADEAGDRLGHMAANRDFHFALLDAAGAPATVRVLSGLWDASDHYRAHYISRPEHRDRIRGEHAGIVSAVADGDAERARDALDAHRDHALQALLGELAG
jgi:DNA-binding GntR family transcriptional regulator